MPKHLPTSSSCFPRKAKYHDLFTFLVHFTMFIEDLALWTEIIFLITHCVNNAANELSTSLKRQLWTCFSLLYSASTTNVLCFNDYTSFANTWKEQQTINRLCCSLFKVRHQIAKDAPLNPMSSRVTKKKKIWYDGWSHYVISVRDLLTLGAGGAADAIGQRQTRLASHKRGSRGLFHLTHTHTHTGTHTQTCAADIRDSGKVIKGKTVWLFFLNGTKKEKFEQMVTLTFFHISCVSSACYSDAQVL